MFAGGLPCGASFGGVNGILFDGVMRGLFGGIVIGVLGRVVVVLAKLVIRKGMPITTTVLTPKKTISKQTTAHGAMFCARVFGAGKSDIIVSWLS